MIDVLEVLSGNRAIIDTTGRYRMVRVEDDEILNELLDEEESEWFLECYNDDVQHYTRARRVSYSELAKAGQGARRSG